MKSSLIAILSSTLLSSQYVISFQPLQASDSLRICLSRPSILCLKSSEKNNEDEGGDSNFLDPRVLRRQARSMRYENESKSKSNSVKKFTKAKAELQKQKDALAAFDLPDQPLVKTIGGGPSTIFAMARRMWDQDQALPEGYASDQQQQQSIGTTSNKLSEYGTNPTPNNVDFYQKWRPTSTQNGIVSNYNPSFRTKAPAMNSEGYASIIWKNVRKRNKPSLWQYALRTYDKMLRLGAEQQDDSTAALKATNIHHQGALLAAAKLGMWEKAISIFEAVEKEQDKLLRKRTTQSTYNENVRSGRQHRTIRKLPVHVTDDMVVSMLYACVRAMRRMSSTEASLKERRRPLDAARQILETVTEKHGIIVESRHYNPLGAAYQKLGLREEAAALIESLKDRRIGPEPEDGNQEPFNVYNVGTKDKASYTLLVSGAVLEEDWMGAVDSLRNMTDAGLYPNQRHLNAWTEVSERKTKHRNTRSWKKKRDEVWIERGLR